MRWLISMTLTPCSFSDLMRSSTLPTSLMASAAVGSSMMTMRASKAVARAIATAWRWPPESSSTFWSMLLHVDLQPLQVLRRHVAGALLVDDREAESFRPGSRPR